MTKTYIGTRYIYFDCSAQLSKPEHAAQLEIIKAMHKPTQKEDEELVFVTFQKEESFEAFDRLKTKNLVRYFWIYEVYKIEAE